MKLKQILKKSRGILTKSKGARIVGSIIKGGTLDILSPGIGAITGAITGTKEGIKQIKKNNLSDYTGGQGKPNYIRYVGIALGLLFIAYLLGFVTEEQVNTILGWLGIAE